MTSRRDVLRNLFKSAAVAGTGGLIWGTVAEKVSAESLTLRPPGAIANNVFIGACIKCGQCVEACPYDTLNLAGTKDNHALGTPYFTPREIPCYMCTNYPCTEACPSGALDLKNLYSEDSKADINQARMGLAVIHKESCIAYWGIQCDTCYRACPLMDEAIILDKDKNEVTGKHANLKPVVQSDVCTGCGLCEHSCVVEKSAIHVLPRHIAMGEVGNHYIKSWNAEDEQRINLIQDETNDDSKDIESALDYLNEDSELFD